MIYSTSKENITQRPFSLSSLYQVDLETLKVDTLFYEDRFVGGAGYSPDGKQLLLTGSPEAFGGIGKNCGNHPIANDFDTQAFIMDLSTARYSRLPKTLIRQSALCNGIMAMGASISIRTMATARTSIATRPKTTVLRKLNLETDVTSAFTLSEYNPGIRRLYRSIRP